MHDLIYHLGLALTPVGLSGLTRRNDDTRRGFRLGPPRSLGTRRKILSIWLPKLDTMLVALWGGLGILLC